MKINYNWERKKHPYVATISSVRIDSLLSIGILFIYFPFICSFDLTVFKLFNQQASSIGLV